MAYIAILIIWGVGYYAMQIGKPMLAGDSRTAPEPVAETPSLDGGALFTSHCSACHQASGAGIPGAFPPLAGSEWVAAEPSLSIAIVHDGLQGEISVLDNTYNGVMPPFGAQLSAPEIAAVLTFIRQEWGNSASAVSAAQVEQHAEQHPERGPWTAPELTDALGQP
jgi:mono/diheme cytochrome c family protein